MAGIGLNLADHYLRSSNMESTTDRHVKGVGADLQFIGQKIFGSGDPEAQVGPNGGGSNPFPAQAVDGSSNDFGNFTYTFKKSGTTFIDDGSKQNSWTPIPWEFPRMWIQNDALWTFSNRFRKWRTKRITFRIKNPVHSYRATTAASNTTIVGTHSSATVDVFRDTSYELGVPLTTGWTIQQLTDWIQSTRFGGFKNSAAVTMPNAVSLEANPLNSFLCSNAPFSNSGGVRHYPCGNGVVIEDSYSPTNGEWRMIEELVCDLGVVRGNGTTYADFYTRAAAQTDIDYVMAFRGDNFGCFRYNPMLCRFGDANTVYYGMELPTFRYRVDGLSTTSSFNYDSWGMIGTAQPVRLRKTESQTSHLNSFLARGGPCIENCPQPQLYVNYKNLLGADFTSLMNSRLQIEFDYEWEVEFGEMRHENVGNDFITGTHGFNNSGDMQAFFYKGRQCFSPHWYATPVYFLNNGIQTDTGYTGEPDDCYVGPKHLLDFRYVSSSSIYSRKRKRASSDSEAASQVSEPKSIKL